MTSTDLAITNTQHWSAQARAINAHWAKKFDAVQRQSDTMLGADFGSSDISALCEHLTTLSEIVENLCDDMVRYYEWRAS